MTPGVFKNRHMTKVKFFSKYKKEPFETFETLEDTYEMPEVLDFEIKDAISIALSKLTPREERVIRGRFFQGENLEDIGQKFSVTRERVRQIEAKALRKLGHPFFGLRKVA